MPIPKPSPGLTTLSEIREGIQRLEQRSVTLTNAIAALVATMRKAAPTPAPQPGPVSIPPRYERQVSEGRIARVDLKPSSANPYRGDRGIAGARRKWWDYGWGNP